MKKILTIVVVVTLALFEAYQQQKTSAPKELTQTVNRNGGQTANNSLKLAYKNRQSDLQIQGKGEVIKVLRDDLEGSRHQKFILKTDGQTVLVAHNIDLAPRIEGLRKGDQVEYNGEYEWNSRGGVLHWTHHDPKGYHTSGWLKHKGKTYQ